MIMTIEEIKTFKFHQDAGHGWLQVPLHLIQKLGLAESISPYSYTDGEYIYLEEDCDAEKFVERYNDFYSTRVDYEIVDDGDYSPIRTLRRYYN